MLIIAQARVVFAFMSVTNPTLSIITVVRNDIIGLRRTLKSIRKQNNLNYELIVVDGGSDDGSAQVAKEFSHIPIESKFDGGIYQGMQRGADVATGKFLLFCNSGDEIFGDQFLSFVINELKTNHESAKWGFGPIIEYTLRDSYSWVSAAGFTSLNSIAYRKTFVPFPSFITSRALFSQLGGFSFDYKIAGDFDLILRCAKEVEPKIWDAPIALFFAGGISYSKANLAWQEEHLIRVRTLGYTRNETIRSKINVSFRILKWNFGKYLDVLQKFGFLGNTNWRTRRETPVPEPFRHYLKR